MKREQRQAQYSALIILILGILCIFYSRCSEANDFVQLDTLSFDFRQYTTDTRYPLITQNGLGHGVDKGYDLNVNMTLLNIFYFDNKVITFTDRPPDGSAGQFRLVGWNWRIGVNVTDNLQVGYYHFSQHELDTTSPWPYPLEDAFEVKIKVFSGDRKPGSIF